MGKDQMISQFVDRSTVTSDSIQQAIIWDSILNAGSGFSLPASQTELKQIDPLIRLFWEGSGRELNELDMSALSRGVQERDVSPFHTSDLVELEPSTSALGKLFDRVSIEVPINPSQDGQVKGDQQSLITGRKFNFYSKANLQETCQKLKDLSLNAFKNGEPRNPTLPHGYEQQWAKEYFL